MTDANIELKLETDLDLRNARKFQHTPKDGSQERELDDFYLQHYRKN